MDKSNNKERNIYDKDFLSLEQGAKIIVELDDKKVLKRHFDRFTNNYNSKYIKEYRTFYLTNIHIVHIPFLEDTIEIKFTNDTIKSFLFIGFNPDGVYLKAIYTNNFTVIPYSQISQIILNKESLNLEEIKKLIFKKIIPMVSNLLIESKGRELKISLNNIKSIRTIDSNLEDFGTVMGAVFDIVILANAIIFMFIFSGF